MKRIFLLFFLISLQVSASYQTDSMNIDNETFLSTLIKENKDLYKNKNWDKFFGNSLFYRAHFLDSKNKQKKFFNKNIIGLELLAYAKHCQWQQVDYLTQTLKQNASNDLIEQIEALSQRVKLLKEMPQSNPKSNTAKLMKKDSEKYRLWKLNIEKIREVKHPKYIRLKVENKCVY